MLGESIYKVCKYDAMYMKSTYFLALTATNLMQRKVSITRDSKRCQLTTHYSQLILNHADHLFTVHVSLCLTKHLLIVLLLVQTR